VALVTGIRGVEVPFDNPDGFDGTKGRDEGESGRLLNVLAVGVTGALDGRSI